MNRPSFSSLAALLLCALVLFLFPTGSTAAPAHQSADPTPPSQPVKLIFIHHSTGGNWLADPSDNALGGSLGRALMENNYYVSATNYGWGPDSIGDATDIPNWWDWFRGENSAAYLEALYHENGQNFGDFGRWPRLADDPGGENVIIMFKSCFPNSDLEGRPDDPPDPDGWLSVGHAKYVYNEILQYFATRPDKLFVVITAPPLSASSTSRRAAENARAFNEWLVNDWLAENNYTLPNVAVFDFYNVLTGPDNHHRWNGGQVEHIFTPGMNTLYYPSDDDHPSRLGNEKATAEFVPLLNIFYHRWADAGMNQPVATRPARPTASSTPSGQPAGGGGVSLPPGTVLTIADFEPGGPAWEANWDASTNTTISCTVEQGSGSGGTASLRMEYSVAAGSWATCVLWFDSPQIWNAGQWVAADLHLGQDGPPFSIMLYGGSPENIESYLVNIEPLASALEGFVPVYFPWDSFLRAAWEADGGTPFDPSRPVIGLGFGFDGLEDGKNSGTVWVDNIRLMTSIPDEEPANGQDEEQQPEPDGGGGGLPCLGNALLPLALFGFAWLIRRW